MTRSRGGNLKPLTSKERARRAARNERRKRSAAITVKRMVVKDKFNPRAIDGESRGTKLRREFLAALKKKMEEAKDETPTDDSSPAGDTDGIGYSGGRDEYAIDA